MGLYIGRRSVGKTKAIIVLAAAFALVAIPTFIGARNYSAHAAGTPPIFINSPRYIHASTTDANQHDIAAEIEFYPGTTQIHLTVDKVLVPAQDVSDPGKDPSGSSRIQIRMPFTPGAHTIEGTAMVGGQEVHIRGANGEESGIADVYALDAPAVSYITPTAGKQAFNSSASPVRVKVDDEFGQFKDLTLTLYTGKPGDADSQKLGDFALDRTACDTLSQGSAICDITAAAGWKNLAEGTYFVTLKTSTKAEDGLHPDGVSADDKNYWSLPFTIDDTAPTATINGPLGVVGGEIVAASGTIDKTASEGTVYVDGDVMGPVVIDDNGAWSYNLKADLTLGNHKVTLLAKDAAGNTNESTIETATTTLTVNPFVPALADVQKVNDGAIGLTTPFAVPQALTQADIPPAPSSNTNADTAVLGAQDAAKGPQNGIAAVAPSSEGWKLFGIAWFWWVLVTVFLIGITSWAFASRRQYATENI